MNISYMLNMSIIISLHFRVRIRFDQMKKVAFDYLIKDQYHNLPPAFEFEQEVVE